MTCNDFQFLSTLKELRQLTLVACKLPEDSKQFGFLTQLTKLEIFGFSPDDASDDTIDVAGIISRLKNLDNLVLVQAPYFIGQNKDFILKEKEFSKIVGIVKERPKALTLKCDCDFNAEKCNKNQKIRLVPINQ